MSTEFQREQQERRATLLNDRRVREQGSTFSRFATDKAEIDQVEIIRMQMEEIAKLRAENQRLVAEADAHAVLKSIYSDPDASQTNRLKAAASAISFEKPKLLSVVPSSEPSRIERWRAFERYRLKREILTETHRLPAPGWDAHLVGDTYQPPAGDAEPPLDVFGKDSISAFCTISSLMPGVPDTGGTSNGKAEDEPSQTE